MNSYNQNIKYSQDELAIQYLPAVRAIAYRIKERVPSSVDVNDLISIGTEELIKLARKYDSAINDSFWGYAKTRVNGALLDYLRSLDIISRANRKLIKSIDSEITRYYNEHQEEPSDEYLSEKLCESIDKIKEARLASDIYLLVPIDEQYQLFSDENIMHKIEQEELVDKIKAVLGNLPEREQLIMQLYFFEELSLLEIKEILQITESRISQIIKEIVKKIRKSIGENHG